jgi:chromate reductase, NAD(P)H dehydrogenase (quinone)
MTYSLVAISGSLRKHSFNTILLKTLSKKAPSDLTIEVCDIGAIPVYNQDLESEDLPEAVISLRAKIKSCDGVIIASPEYNHGMAGSTKNVLDWLSRPYGKAALAGKPSMVITSSPGGTGGVRAQAQLLSTLSAIGAHPLGGAEIIITDIHHKIDHDTFTDQSNLEFIFDQIKRLKTDIDLRRA